MVRRLLTEHFLAAYLYEEKETESQFLLKMMRAVLMVFFASATITFAQRTPVSLNACAATTCQVGAVCVESNGVARCVAPPGNTGSNKCKVQFEEWRECSGCEATCDNKRPFCTRMCQPARCQCRQGFFRNRQGQCVTENDCDVAAMNASSGSPRARRSSITVTCANLRCAGVPCTDTPTGPSCG